ncbi:glycerate kinase subfamily protein [Acanthamoeba castellanii str. Neff]|uniref:Glycerate kinase subfamily protein n=1 Tax=Acanthamoeba castellanii (strain ATCC 30010 / Neff) TaxID=1257118 RepID=L8H8F1_ACACF|nr:glycerate kinase subfamily protein [Acanthamoeba castellanii str. Neff]ELR21445.1 glycerate kinase subfamily protein [Acanthamoeba castellanii str. Neff]
MDKAEREGVVRVLGCFDSFKDSLEADLVADAVLHAIAHLYPGRVETRSLSLSDGGNGFLNALKGPLALKLASYGSSTRPDCAGRLAVVEMASASGLEKVPLDLRNPLHTTTEGTGQLMQHAFDEGHSHIIVGMGGSATNDGGLGCLHALGVRVRIQPDDEDPEEHPPIVFGRHLNKVTSLTMPESGVLKGATVEIASDVDNPFVGEKGAVAVFSAQKGATEEIQKRLEAGMHRVAGFYRDSLPLGIDVAHLPGAGSAGGLTGGIVATTGAKIKRGIEFVAEALGLEEAIKGSDLVLTGEGRYDTQTQHGKTVSEVQKLAKKHHKPVVVICGSKKDIPEGEDHHVYELVSMYDLDTCMNRTAQSLDGLVRANASRFPVLSRLGAPQDQASL